MPEGQFLPETYRFPSGTTDVELLRQAHAALDARVATRRGRTAIPTLPLQNADELLIVASIVEKESGMPQELPKIAGLYLHRLRIGMRLQADPTVIYGLGERYDGDLHTVDLAHRRTLQHLYARGLAADADRACRRRRHSGDRASREYRRDIFRRLRQGRRQPCFFRDAGGAKRGRRAYVAHLRQKAAECGAMSATRRRAVS